MKKTMFVLLLVSAFASLVSAQAYVPPQAKVFIDEGETQDEARRDGEVVDLLP